MKKILLFVLISCGIVCAQEGSRRKPIPVLNEVSNKEVVQSIFPEALKVDKLNDFWFKISDNQGKALGYAMTSTAFCKDVIGYNNTTPIMIITDKKFVIQKTALLSNWETLGYVRKLERKGFFNLWNGKKLSDAVGIQLDAYAGATITAKAVAKNVDFLITNGSKKLPKN